MSMRPVEICEVFERLGLNDQLMTFKNVNALAQETTFKEK
jgi:hypothetical protein